MASSLDKLASYLKQQPTLRKVFGQDYENAQIKLLTKKGVFPYEYISSLEKLQETALPPPEQFYSSLTDSDISTKNYEDAMQVWDSFKISNLGEYSDIYPKADVLLLVEVFENFRKTCHEAYELDPAHYYTLPGYSWDAMLLYTQVQLELLTDIEILLFIEKGICGGVSQCCSRFSEANNRYMGEDYNPEKEDVYLMYYDIDNLYGWAMAQYLPYGGFEWDDTKDYLTLPEDSEHGYILEVDLEYPESLHDLHKDLPLFPEHACPPGWKQRYSSHKNPSSIEIIDLNTEKRKNGKNDFEKQQYKLFLPRLIQSTHVHPSPRIIAPRGCVAHALVPCIHSCPRLSIYVLVKKYARMLSCFSPTTSSKIISEFGRASSGESTASCSLNDFFVDFSILNFFASAIFGSEPFLSSNSADFFEPESIAKCSCVQPFSSRASTRNGRCFSSPISKNSSTKSSSKFSRLQTMCSGVVSLALAKLESAPLLSSDSTASSLSSVRAKCSGVLPDSS
ncbi:unnamed protein product [Trichogramma brassicae]|uniref:DNA-directed DNA polymerase n=1 Tax=Trichogramma brassicae TaxID=86971 RepID=A0A6H5IPS7_9HYME|nr:unnamed protein product [Trichogramma brassicae]